MTTTFGATIFPGDPFFTGTSAFSSDIPSLFPIALAGHGYLAELSLYERQTVPRVREPFDASDEPGEHSLNTTGTWPRSASHWDHGAGQDFWDQSDSDRRRFRASKGVDIWTAQHRIQLLHDTRKIRNSAAANLKVLAVGGYLYVTDGNDVLHSNAPTGASPSFTDAAIEAADGAGSVSDITTDGTLVYAALGANGVHHTALGASTSTHLSAFAANLVEYANGRLFAANNDVLAEIPASGTAATILDHANASFDWTAIAGAPNGVYAGGNAGDRSELYYIGVDTTDGSLAAAISAGSLPDGETINCMEFYQGVMILGTSRGLRLADIVSGNGLSPGPVIEAPGGVTAIEPQGEFIWFSWANYDSTSTGLGRANLAQFTDVNVPAYASDLMATAQGTIGGVCTIGTRRYFAVQGSGIWAEFTDLVASGTIYSGWVNDSTVERKVAISVDLRHDPLNGQVTAALLSEEGNIETVGSSMAAGSLGPEGPLGVGALSSEAFEVQITLTRAVTTTLGPLLRRWTFRTLVTPARVDEINLAIHLDSRLSVPDAAGAHDAAIDTLEEFLFLKSLESSGAPVRYQEGAHSYTVYVEQVGLPRDQAREWNDDHSFPEGLCFLHLVTLEPSA